MLIFHTFSASSVLIRVLPKNLKHLLEMCETLFVYVCLYISVFEIKTKFLVFPKEKKTRKTCIQRKSKDSLEACAF